MSKGIVNLCSKTVKNNDKTPHKLTYIQLFLPMIIFDRPEKDLSNVDRKSDMRKVCTSSVN